MSSSVFFKFKSQKEPQRVLFDGTGISVFELKRDIISISQLGDGSDFDLSIYNEDTEEEYVDDTVIVPRSTSVVARRLPASKPGQGRAQRYVSGKMPITAKNSHRVESQHNKQPLQTKSSSITSGVGDAPQTEADRIAAMLQADADSWEQQQQQMAGQKAVYNGKNFKGRPATVPDHPPPAGYICYRCGEKGHWIQVCPTNDDPNFENRPRIKRTTGIPRSMLQVVEKPKDTPEDSGDGSKQPSGIMVNAEGEFVVARPDVASWQQFQEKQKASRTEADDASSNKELEDRGLLCPIDKRLFVDPHKTPCCGKTYCHDCIENALVNADLICPACKTENVLIDNLEPDKEMLTKIQEYEKEKKEEKEKAAVAAAAAREKELEKEKEAEASRSPKTAGSVTAADASTPTGNSPSRNESKAQLNVDSPSSRPASVTSASGQSNSKKRAAEDDLVSDRAAPGVPTTSPRLRDDAAVKSPKITNDKPTSPKPASQNPITFEQQMNAMAQSMKPGTNQQMPQQQMPMNGFMGMGMPGMPMPSMNMNMPGMPGMPPFDPNMMQQMMASMGGDPSMMMGMGNPLMANGGGNGMMGMNMNGFQNGNIGGWNNNQNQNQNQRWGNNGWQNNNNQFNNAGWNNNQNYNNQFGQQQNFGGGEGDSAYFRKPVNPNRHPNRQRRQRPQDFKEL